KAGQLQIIPLFEPRCAGTPAAADLKRSRFVDGLAVHIKISGSGPPRMTKGRCERQQERAQELGFGGALEL
ncbi:MAG: hypothetical protein ABSF53_17310, partial [Terracidiphilus sp.]